MVPSYTRRPSNNSAQHASPFPSFLHPTTQDTGNTMYPKSKTGFGLLLGENLPKSSAVLHSSAAKLEKDFSCLGKSSTGSPALSLDDLAGITHEITAVHSQSPRAFSKMATEIDPVIGHEGTLLAAQDTHEHHTLSLVILASSELRVRNPHHS